MATPKQGKDRTRGAQEQRCHYVPRFFLANFSAKGNELLLFDTRPGKEARWRPDEKPPPPASRRLKVGSARKAFQVRGLYSEGIERRLGRLEQRGARALRKVIESAKTRDLRAVGDAGRSDLGKFFLTLLMRSSPYHLAVTELKDERIVNYGISRWFHKDMIEGIEDHGDIAQEEFEKRLDLVLGMDLPLIEGLLVARIRDRCKAFVTGSVPFATVGENGRMGTFIPVSPKVAVCFSRVESDHMFEPDARLVATINNFIFEFSDKIVVQSDRHANSALEDAKIVVWPRGRTMLAAYLRGFRELAISLMAETGGEGTAR